MPNWCSTTYKCVGDLKEVKSLYKILQKMNHRKTPKRPNGFGNMWLGELVSELGFDWEKLRCRGSIEDFSFDNGILTIYQETAWCEQEGVRQAIEQKYPSIKVYYQEEEPGCDVYDTNDTSGAYFPERYFLDSYGDSEYFDTLDEVAEYVSGLVGHKVEADFRAIEHALDDYTEAREENDEEVFYSLHEFQVIEE